MERLLEVGHSRPLRGEITLVSTVVIVIVFVVAMLLFSCVIAMLLFSCVIAMLLFSLL